MVGQIAEMPSPLISTPLNDRKLHHSNQIHLFYRLRSTTNESDKKSFRISNYTHTDSQTHSEFWSLSLSKGRKRSTSPPIPALFACEEAAEKRGAQLYTPRQARGPHDSFFLPSTSSRTNRRTFSPFEKHRDRLIHPRIFHYSFTTYA